MKREEFNTFYRKLESTYSNFTGTEEEWWDVVKKFSFNDVMKKLNDHIETKKSTPIHINLVKGLKEEANEPGAWMKCEYCKKLELVFDTDEWIKAHRKCQQIDFIDRQSKAIKGVGITKQVYYDMGEIEFEKIYREVMNYYLKHNTQLVMKSL